MSHHAVEEVKSRMKQVTLLTEHRLRHSESCVCVFTGVSTAATRVRNLHLFAR